MYRAPRHYLSSTHRKNRIIAYFEQLPALSGRTVAQLSRTFKVSKPTVSRLVRELVDDGRLICHKEMTPGRGFGFRNLYGLPVKHEPEVNEETFDLDV